MFFASDNSGPAAPQVMDAIVAANTGYQGSYGSDELMDRVRAQVREIFETPEAAVYLVATGTAANSFHMDGARFSNALVSTNASAADMTWRAGVDALSFGGTKNGLLGVEAVVFFDPRHAWEFELRRKRSGHLFSKHRYLSAQMEAYLTDDLWLDMARHANNAATSARWMQVLSII